MRIDANGNELRQVSVWLPVAVIRLMRADGINVSRFIRDQLEILYGNSFGEPQDRRSRLAQAARESLDRQRRVEEAREAEREEARSAVRQMRTERDAAKVRQEGILDALQQIFGDDTPRHYSRMLPENDLNGDRVDDWEALVRRVSRLCGAEIDSAEVVVALRTLIAAA